VRQDKFRIDLQCPFKLGTRLFRSIEKEVLLSQLIDRQKIVWMELKGFLKEGEGLGRLLLLRAFEALLIGLPGLTGDVLKIANREQPSLWRDRDLRLRAAQVHLSENRT
jgi:hypothetical protein